MCHKLAQEEWNQLKTKTVIKLNFTPGNCFNHLMIGKPVQKIP